MAVGALKMPLEDALKGTPEYNPKGTLEGSTEVPLKVAPRTKGWAAEFCRLDECRSAT